MPAPKKKPSQKSAPSRDGATPSTARVYDADLSTLEPDQRNANKGTERGRAMLGRSISELGAGRSIVIDAKGRTVAGNKSLEAFVAAGMTEAIVVESDGTRPIVVKRTDWNLNDKKGAARKYAYADNRIGEIDLSWDIDILLADADAGNEFMPTIPDSNPSDPPANEEIDISDLITTHLCPRCKFEF